MPTSTLYDSAGNPHAAPGILDQNGEFHLGGILAAGSFPLGYGPYQADGIIDPDGDLYTYTSIAAASIVSGQSIGGVSGTAPLGGLSVPDAASSVSPILAQCVRGTTGPFYARVVDPNTGTWIQQSAIASIAYTIYQLGRDDPNYWQPVAGHTAVALTVADVVWDSLQADANLANWNMRHTPDLSLGVPFPEAGRVYALQYTLTMASGQPLSMTVLVDCLPMVTGQGG
jgi:hypothetical protein